MVVEGVCYDYVVSNPPYGVKLKAHLYEGFDFSHKNFRVSESLLKDVLSELLFCEYAIKSVQAGGKATLLIPNSVLSNHALGVHRDYLVDKAKLLFSISIPPHAFYFANTSVKTGIIVLEKWKNESSKASSYNVMLGIVENIGFDTRGKPTDKNDVPSIQSEILRHYSEMQEQDVIQPDILRLKRSLEL